MYVYTPYLRTITLSLTAFDAVEEYAHLIVTSVLTDTLYVCTYFPSPTYVIICVGASMAYSEGGSLW